MLATLLGCALIVAACSGDDAGGDASTLDGTRGHTGEVTDDAPAADQHAEGEAEVPGTGRSETAPSGAGQLDGVTVQNVDAGTGRRIVRTAQLELEVEDAAAAADRVARIADDAGGFVAETDLVRELDGTVFGSITLRVPAAELFTTVEALDALAVAVPVRRIDERDVTAESTDLQARLTNLTAYEIELRTLLADVRETTSRPDDLLTVFERIRSVRADIDQAEARLALLDDQVSLSTISVTLRPASSAVPVLDPTWAPSETLRDALATTTHALAGIADVAIRLVVTVVPIGLLLGAPVLVAVLVWRRVRGDRTPPAPTAPASSSP